MHAIPSNTHAHPQEWQVWAMAKEPLTSSLLKLKDPQEQEKALLLFKLVWSGVDAGWVCTVGIQASRHPGILCDPGVV